MFQRIFTRPKSLSFFLFGARGTGKSTLLRQQFKDEPVLWFDLLDRDLEGRLQRRPSSLSEEIAAAIKSNAKISWIVIDEVQKIPELLDTVHREIERKRVRFALTGSSSRKLKRGGANLLAGRALENHLFPLTHRELGDKFDLDFVLRWGSLPQVFSVDESERKDYLRTYVHTYLKEEVIAEQLLRKLPPFRAFLDTIGSVSGKIINYSNIARDVGSDSVTVKSYFEILEETYLGFHLSAYHRSIRKRQRQNPKFYIFDLGVAAGLRNQLNLAIEPQTYAYGDAFEQFIVCEIYRLNHYLKKDWRLSYLRTKDDAEIDLVIERPGQKTALIEIKSKSRIDPTDVSGLARLASDFPKSEAFCFSQDLRPKVINGVSCIDWRRGMVEIGLDI